MDVTQKTIGERIVQLRKRKGWSQSELSALLGLSRSSLAQIELGNRHIELFEFQRMGNVLGFSLDDMLSVTYNVSELLHEPIAEYKPKAKERNSIALFELEKCKNILLYMLERCAGKPNVGETVLYKLMYFSDFNYYEKFEEHLTGMNYRKLPSGPVPQFLDDVLNRMVADEQIYRIKTTFQHLPQTRFLPLTKPDLTNLKASEKDVIDRVIDQMSDWSSSTLTNYSHKDIPWLASKDGELMNYELVFYREAPFSVRNYDEEETE